MNTPTDTYTSQIYLYKVIPECMSLGQVPEGTDQYMNSTNVNRPALQPARAMPSMQQGNNSWEPRAEAATHRKLPLQPGWATGFQNPSRGNDFYMLLITHIQTD